jgi:hypothetical protein
VEEMVEVVEDVDEESTQVAYSFKGMIPTTLES